MIIGSAHDPNSKNKLTENTNIPSLSFLHPNSFNTVCQRGNSRTSRHNSAQEISLSIYVAFLLYSQTRYRLLVDKFHDLGLSISYDQILVLSTQLGNSVCTQFESDCVVCPTKLCSNVFTTFAVDNIYNNPSSRSVKNSWHAAAISSTLHIESKGIKHCSIQLADAASKVLQPLSKKFTTVHTSVLKSEDVCVPCLSKRKGF